MARQYGEESRERLGRAESKADIRYHKQKSKLPPHLKINEWASAVQGMCAQYVLDLIVAEARECVADKCPLDEIETFLSHRVEELALEVMDSPKWPVEPQRDPGIAAMLQKVNLGRIIDGIKSSKEWRKCQREIFGQGPQVRVTDGGFPGVPHPGETTDRHTAFAHGLSAAGTASAGVGATPSGGDESDCAGAGPLNEPIRRGYRSEIKAYMEANGLATNQIAARHFGVGVDTLKSIMSSKGEQRYAEETLDKVLAKARIGKH